MSNIDRFYLCCPYAEKDECKALGGRWDPDTRKWYVPIGLDVTQFKDWWPDPAIVEEHQINDQ